MSDGNRGTTDFSSDKANDSNVSGTAAHLGREESFSKCDQAGLW